MSKIQTNPSIITRDSDKIAAKTGNVYESVSIIAQRARQISSSVDNLEEIFENREQIEISKYYERLPKPTSLAIDEFMADKVAFRVRDEEEASK